MAESGPCATARIAHGGVVPPSAFPVQPDFRRIGILSAPQDGAKLKLRPLSFKAPPRTAKVTINAQSFLGTSTALLAGGCHWTSLDASSPDGCWLVSAGSHPSSLLLWRLPEASLVAQLSTPDDGFLCSAVSWCPDSAVLAVTFERGEDRCVRTYDSATGAQLGALQADASSWTCGHKLEGGDWHMRAFVWQPTPSEEGPFLAGFAEDALMVLQRDCSVELAVPVQQVTGRMPTLPGDILAFAWVPGPAEVVCYKESAMLNVIDIMRVPISGGRPICQSISEHFLCRPIFSARAMAGVTARNVEVTIVHNEPGSQAMPTGLLDSHESLPGSIIWSPSGSLLAVGNLMDTGGTGRTGGLVLDLFDWRTAHRVHSFDTSLEDVPVALPLHLPGFVSAVPLWRHRRVTWAADGSAVAFSMHEEGSAALPDGSEWCLDVSCHFVVAGLSG